MTATMIFGRGFRLERDSSYPDKEVLTVVGIDGDCDWLSWSSVREMVEAAARHGVDPDRWPVYPDLEIEAEAPLDEIMERSAELRQALAGLDDEAIGADHWLTVVARLLRDGHSFFIMV